MSLLPDREKEEMLYTEAGCVYYGILGSNIKFSLFQTMSDQIDEGRKEYGDNPGKFFFEAREAFSEAASLISPDRWRTTDLIFNPDRMIFDEGESKFYYVLGNVPAEYSIAEENSIRGKQLKKQYRFSDLKIGYKSNLVPHGNNMCLGYFQIRGMHKNPVMFEFTEGFLMGTLVLAGCGEESSESASSGTSSAESSASEAAESETPSAEETGDVLSGTLGDYDVTIIGAQLCEDYEGNPAIMITYNWTNNSDDNRMAATSVTADAFQNGIEMDTAFVSFSYNHSSTEVQPGYSTDVDLLYKLDGDSPVEFEMVAVSDMLKSDATKLTATFDPAELSHYEG